MKKIVCLLLVLCLGLVGCSKTDYGIFTKEVYENLTDEERAHLTDIYNQMLSFANEIKNENYEEAELILSKIDYDKIVMDELSSISTYYKIKIIFTGMELGTYNNTKVQQFFNKEETKEYNYELERIKLLDYLNEDAVNDLIITNIKLDEFKEYRYSKKGL